MNLEGKGQNQYEDNCGSKTGVSCSKFNKHLLSNDYVLDTVPSAEHIAENKIDILPHFHKAYILVEETISKQIWAILIT